MQIHVVQSAQAPAAIGPYAQAVRSGNFLFSSGQIALRPDGTLVNGGIEEQTRQVLENLKAVLEAGGASLSQVLKTTVFLADMNDFPKLNEVYAQYFGAHTPARSTVQVARLPKDVRVEIDVVAVVP